MYTNKINNNKNTKQLNLQGKALEEDALCSGMKGIHRKCYLFLPWSSQKPQILKSLFIFDKFNTTVIIKIDTEIS